MELLIDDHGNASETVDGAIYDAVWKRGFIHIRQAKRSVIVSLCPELVNGTTVTAALYEVADLRPARVCVITNHADSVAEVFAECKDALRSICEIVSTGGRQSRGHSYHSHHNPGRLAPPVPEDDPESIIAIAVKRHVKGDPEALAQALMEQLWEAGFDIRPRTDLVPIGRPRP